MAAPAHYLADQAERNAFRRAKELCEALATRIENLEERIRKLEYGIPIQKSWRG